MSIEGKASEPRPALTKEFFLAMMKIFFCFLVTKTCPHKTVQLFAIDFCLETISS